MRGGEGFDQGEGWTGGWEGANNPGDGRSGYYQMKSCGTRGSGLGVRGWGWLEANDTPGRGFLKRVQLPVSCGGGVTCIVRVCYEINRSWMDAWSRSPTPWPFRTFTRGTDDPSLDSAKFCSNDLDATMAPCSRHDMKGTEAMFATRSD